MDEDFVNGFVKEANKLKAAVLAGTMALSGAAKAGAGSAKKVMSNMKPKVSKTYRVQGKPATKAQYDAFKGRASNFQKSQRAAFESMKMKPNAVNPFSNVKNPFR